MRTFIHAYPLAVLTACTLLAACGDSSDRSAQPAASGGSGAASEDTASANGNGTPTGLPPPPWAMSAPQPASDGLRPPVIHTVE
ncbi:hypothetical protein [Paraburkholderia humisilvae]|uniref:Uncharacterized protein n=1 Tax=Paraburkholderia humisilvae TaxID=627669 RepID=A0A6J5D7T8_9BURK|nr:hypothetical protein [Paraburkholderia humisilvae]CAB3749487.1 hypothetical protein LMG29542_01005 [Paraburkholderia humisilvae]